MDTVCKCGQRDGLEQDGTLCAFRLVCSLNVMQ